MHGCDCVCADVWRCGVMQDGTSPLLDACSRGDTAIVKVLLSVADVNPNMARSVSGRCCVSGVV